MHGHRIKGGDPLLHGILLLLAGCLSSGCITGPEAEVHEDALVPAAPEWIDGEEASSGLWIGERQLPYTDESFLTECGELARSMSKSGVKRVRISYHTGSAVTKIQVVSPVTRESLAEARIVWPCVEWVNFQFEE